VLLTMNKRLVKSNGFSLFESSAESDEFRSFFNAVILENNFTKKDDEPTEDLSVRVCIPRRRL